MQISSKSLWKYKWQILEAVTFILGVLGMLLSLLFLLPQLSEFSLSSKEAQVLEKQNFFTQAELFVDVAGAVKNPGLYALPVNSRRAQAIKVAGGLRADADRRFLAREFNLAVLLEDAEKIYIPFLAEQPEPNCESPSIERVSSKSLNTQNKISINSASHSELETLEGVGEVRARAIIDGRPYKTIFELVDREVISESIYEKNESQLRL